MKIAAIKLTLFFALFLSAGSNALAQEFGDEARETLRFIRLAETKKNLDLPEDKLLKLNAYLDEYENQKLQLKKQQVKLFQRIKRGNYDDANAGQIYAEVLELKRAESEADLALWQGLGDFLSPKESIDFLRFYERFTTEVRRRLRTLQQNRPRGRFRQQQ